MTMATERLESLEQVRAFVEGSEGLDFAAADRSSRNDFVRRMLVRFDYAALGKATGLSRAQLTRLIGQRAKTGRIVDRRSGAPAKPFARRYTARDMVLLAEVCWPEGWRAVAHGAMRATFDIDVVPPDPGRSGQSGGPDAPDRSTRPPPSLAAFA